MLNHTAEEKKRLVTFVIKSLNATENTQAQRCELHTGHCNNLCETLRKSEK